jgi:parvulin-like peptidyl-prolyl isomerase
MPGLSINAWSGPLQSAYGLHLVQLVRRTEARTPALAEVRERVQRDWTSANTREASVRHYDELRRRYTVVIEPPAAERVSAASR